MHYSLHDLLEEMGRKIVRGESADPGERRWLWNHEDIYKVFRRNSGTKKIQGICLETIKRREVQLYPDTFEKMWNLKFLKIRWWHFKFKVPKGISAFPDELRYLHWEGYPLESLPANSNLENLIELRLPYSQITELFCNEMQVLGKLREIDLSGCKQLCKISNLSRAPNVTRLNLDGCDSLCEVSSSICHLSNVTVIYLSSCRKLRSLPDLSDLKSLEELDLSFCLNLETFPNVPRSTKILNLRHTAIKEVPSASGEYLDNLVELHMSNCPKLRSLPDLSDLKSLEELDLSFCWNLETFPNVPRSTKILNLCFTAIKEVPSASVEYLDKVKLVMPNYPKLRSLRDLSDLKSRRKLFLKGCSKLETFPKVPRSTLLKLGAKNVVEGHAKSALENKRCKEDMPPLMSQLGADEPGRNLGSREMDEGPPRSKRLKSTKHGTA